MTIGVPIDTESAGYTKSASAFTSAEYTKPVTLVCHYNTVRVEHSIIIISIIIIVIIVIILSEAKRLNTQRNSTASTALCVGLLFHR